MTSAVIVLAHEMDREGNLDVESAERAALAVDVYRDTDADWLITSGWAYRKDTDATIACALKCHIVREHCLPGDRIIEEPHARDTVGDAWFTRVNVVDPMRIETVDVVTSDYHRDRTEIIFGFIHADTVTVTVHGASSDRHPENEQRSLAAFRETFRGVRAGDRNAIGEVLATRHPFYNGEIHPVIGAQSKSM